MTIFPKILIIIVTWNKKTFVLELLTSLKSLDYSLHALDILVVDNASTDGTAQAIAAQFPQVKLCCNAENLGGTGGFNTGLQWAFEHAENGYKYLWLLDNDVLVHRRALIELVTLLEHKPDLGIAGSTMMQLDYPWRINEMGAFLDQQRGQLILHRHLEQILPWQGVPIVELLIGEADLSQRLMHCNSFMDVDYVAAASLLVRAQVAQEAGLWRDYFIHLDDVEWCLRIAKQGYRVVVCAKSLIWHLSAAAKVPTWVLYYDNRNLLDLMRTHGTSARGLREIIRYILKKAVYYTLIGKTDLAQLHHFAVQDFHKGIFGKREINLTGHYQKNTDILHALLEPSIQRILVVWTVNIHATKIQEALVQVRLQRPDLQIDWLPLPEGVKVYQYPQAHFLAPLSKWRLKRWLTYFKMSGTYQLVIQSDYQPIMPLCWIKAKILFINDEGFCIRPAPQWQEVWQAGLQWLMAHFRSNLR